jgi:hypothetical protein
VGGGLGPWQRKKEGVCPATGNVLLEEIQLKKNWGGGEGGRGRQKRL